jgi:hypothetical protein
MTAVKRQFDTITFNLENFIKNYYICAAKNDNISHLIE